jgi:hypothetical protein
MLNTHTPHSLLRPRRSRMLLLSLCAALLLGSCQSAYYSIWQKLGYEKRDILVSRVEGARDAQDAAKTQFVSTMDQFKSLTNFNGGDLEAEYDKLSAQYDKAKERADAVSSKIASVDSCAQAMFSEWNSELSQYQDPNLRAQSQKELDDSKVHYAQLLAAMKKSEAKMQPVLGAFHDQVLFLKHNLNAAAISSLHETAAGIDTDVQQLVQDMEASINESNNFIDNMKKT